MKKLVEAVALVLGLSFALPALAGEPPKEGAPKEGKEQDKPAAKPDQEGAADKEEGGAKKKKKKDDKSGKMRKAKRDE